VEEARNKKLELLAITDHGIRVPDAPKILYFYNLRVIPKEINGIRIVKGVEANIIDYKGSIDMTEEVLGRLELVIASLHDLCIDSGTVSENTEAVLGAIKNPFVNIIGHPDNPHFPIDYDEIAAAAAEYGKALELNNSSPVARKGCEENTIKVAEKAKKYKTKLAIGSDAHISFDVGNFNVIEKLINDLQIPQELIINLSKEKVLSFLKL
jgi:putative hydrolase